MSDYTIDVLPEEVLIDIFKLLDLDTLKEVVLTCKKWRDIAEWSVPWSLKLFYDNQVLSDTEWFEVWTELMLASNRKYTTVTIDDLLDLESSKTMEMFTKFGPNITTLKLYCCNMEKLPLLIEFFNLMKNLKKLIILKTTSGIPDEDIVALNITDLPEFPKLKELEMIESEYTYFELFKAAKLTSLKVMNEFDSDAFQPSAEPLKNLLATQKDLKKLALRSFNHETSKFFEAQIGEENIPFKLKELSLMNIKLKESPNEYNNLLKFMNMHCKTIEKLELSSKFPDFVYEFIFAKMKNLKSLRMKANLFPTDPSFFDRLENNKSVTSLTLVEDANSSISHLFKHLPNIEHIEMLEDSSYEILKSISENLKNLKSLKVKCFNGSLFRNLNFPTLKALSIGCVEDIEWDLFTKEAPRITHLFIEDFDDFLEDMNIKKIMRVFKIESLTINCEVYADKEFFDEVQTYGSSLKSLKMNIGNWDDTGAITNIRGLCFHEVPVKDPLATEGAWNEESYDENFPADSTYNAWEDLEAMDPFDLQLMMEDFNFENDSDENDDYDDYGLFYGDEDDYDDEYDNDVHEWLE